MVVVSVVIMYVAERSSVLILGSGAVVLLTQKKKKTCTILILLRSDLAKYKAKQIPRWSSIEHMISMVTQQPNLDLIKT